MPKYGRPHQIWQAIVFALRDPSFRGSRRITLGNIVFSALGMFGVLWGSIWWFDWFIVFGILTLSSTWTIIVYEQEFPRDE